MFCDNCGAQVHEGAFFCIKCGVRLGTHASQPGRPMVTSPRSKIRIQKIFLSPDSVIYALKEVEADRKSGGEKFSEQSWTKEAVRKVPGIGRFVADNFALTFELADNFGVDEDRLKMTAQGVVILVFASIYHELHKDLPRFTVQECEKNFQEIFHGVVDSEQLIYSVRNFCSTWGETLDGYLRFERTIPHTGFANRVRATTFCMVKALIDQLYETI